MQGGDDGEGLALVCMGDGSGDTKRALPAPPMRSTATPLRKHCGRPSCPAAPWVLGREQRVCAERKDCSAWSGRVALCVFFFHTSSSFFFHGVDLGSFFTSDGAPMHDCNGGRLRFVWGREIRGAASPGIDAVSVQRGCPELQPCCRPALPVCTSLAARGPRSSPNKCPGGLL